VPATERAVDLPALRRLHDHIGILNRCRSLTQTLRAVVEGVVDVVGFEVAAINYVLPDGSFEVRAVAGNALAREQLLNQRLPADTYDAEFAIADHWGTLRFVPHERLPGGQGEGWVPDLQPLKSADAWHPHDALFAPLCSAAGDLVGVLSVDVPHDRRRPGMLQREILEMFATQAGIAIDNAQLTERLQASEEAFRLAFEGAGNGMALVSLSPLDHGRYMRVNAALCRILGRSAEDLLRLRSLDITHPDDRERAIADMHDAVAGGPKVHRVEKRYIDANGATVWAAVTSSIVEDAAGGVHFAIVQIEDITERRAVREELTRRAGHDDLTGLANRHTFQERLAAAADQVRATATPGALLFCDVDHFKAINDTYGHVAGDHILTVIAQRLTAASRRGDTAARLGGDEFVVVAQHATLEDAERLRRRLRRAVAAPIRVNRTMVRLTISIGIAPLSTHDLTTLLHEADVDMYQRKSNREPRNNTSPKPHSNLTSRAQVC
jgi:diguanylate cyclase (GGDEF)-like protein/PAS domain S-box-containing protein